MKFESLENVLAAVRAAEVPEAPAEVENRVLAAFDARGQVRQRQFGWRFAIAATIAAVLIVTVATRWLPPTRSVTDTAFLEIPYVVPLAPYERLSVKRMDVPVAALVAAGFEVHAHDTGATLLADVLFGQDGRAHAIRLVNH